ncbi:MAG: filamentous hemagglutinin N-terminal domain-containing protein [Parachlamydiales bacterium]|nr:filamentous hemagglutinin N-terminal domain-containing protein [Parachlamydiales bacterium]
MKFSKFSLLGLSILCIFEGEANPKGGRSVSGAASFETLSPKVLEIAADNQAIIEWNEFSIAPGETTRFIQPDSQSSVLNRVVADLPSHILGSLEANGKVFLLNPNGILIGENGTINTAAFFASTLDLLNEDFLKNGELRFKGDSEASIVNLGTIRGSNGDVVLIGRSIQNNGTIDAKGAAAIAAGREVLLRPGQEELIWIRPQEEKLQTQLKNEGNAYALAIQHSGKIQAKGIEKRGGKIFLVAEEGTAEVAGSLIAQKGDVRVLADSIYLKDTAVIDVSSEFGGGTVLIGGDERGRNPDTIPQARSVYADGRSTVKANSLREGDGGKVIAWGTEVNSYLGRIEAKGGPISGNGGFVEVSSPGKLGFLAQVDTTAPAGCIGMLLLDPSQIDITAATAGVVLGNCGFSASTYASSINMGTLDVTALQSQLMSATTTITTFDGSCGLGGNGSITFSSPLTILAGSNDLILSAQGDININAAITNNSATSSIDMTAGTGAATGIITINSPISYIMGSSGHLNLTSNTSSANGISILAPLTVNTGGLQLATDRNIHITGNATISGPITVHGLLPMNPCGQLYVDATNNAMGVNARLVNINIAQSTNILADSIRLDGSMNPSSLAVLETQGPLTANVTHAVNITGGNGNSSYATMGAVGTGSTLVFNAESLTIQGGTGSSALAELQGQGPMQITLTGSGAPPSGCLQILAGSGGQAFLGGPGKVDIAVDGDIKMTSNGAGGQALLVTGQAMTPSTISFKGELLINGTGFSEMFASGSLSITGTGTYTQGVNPGRLSLTPGANGDAIIALDANGTLSINIPENLIITGPPGGAPALGLTGILGTPTAGNNSILNFAQIGGDVILTGGAVANYKVIIGSPQLAGIPGGNTTVSIAANGSQGIVLNGASANMAFVAIGTAGGTTANPVTVSVPNGNISLTSTNAMGVMGANTAILTNGGFLNISTGGNISLNGTANNPASFAVNAGTGSIQAIAGNSISLNDFASITSTQDITLVIDNNNPTSPSIGTATFSTGTLSSISANGGNGNLQIFTTIPSLVTISGTLNGAPFVQGPIGIDTPQEHYMVYYPNVFVNPVAPHFTVFYKGLSIPNPPTPTPLTPTEIISTLSFYNTVQRGLQEFLDDLQAYLDFDYLNFSEILFTLSFTPDFIAFFQPLPSLFNNEKSNIKMFRREYNNYNLRRINLLK